MIGSRSNFSESETIILINFKFPPSLYTNDPASTSTGTQISQPTQNIDNHRSERRNHERRGHERHRSSHKERRGNEHERHRCRHKERHGNEHERRRSRSRHNETERRGHKRHHNEQNDHRIRNAVVGTGTKRVKDSGGNTEHIEVNLQSLEKNQFSSY